MEEIIQNDIVEETTQEESAKTYTQEEVMALLQRESDKRVNQALNKQKKEFDKKLSLSKLDGDEREKAEKDARIEELTRLVEEMNIEKNKSELKSVLASRGLSAEFCDILNITDDIEASQANIDKLDKLFKAAVRAEVEKRLAGAAPRGNGGSSVSTEISREEARKMSMVERQNLLNSNPELYKKLFN